MSEVINPTPAAAGLIRWLLAEGGRFESSRTFVESAGQRLIDAGVPLFRLGLTLTHFHPVLRASTSEWVRGTDAREIARPRNMMGSRVFSHSPIAQVMRTREPLRRRLVGPEAEFDFPVLEELRDKGLTDYYVMPLDMGYGLQGGIVTYGSDHPDGFQAHHLHLLDDIAPALAAIGQIHSGRR